jgi:hypothetical protein
MLRTTRTIFHRIHTQTNDLSKTYLSRQAKRIDLRHTNRAHKILAAYKEGHTSHGGWPESDLPIAINELDD